MSASRNPAPTTTQSKTKAGEDKNIGTTQKAAAAADAKKAEVHLVGREPQPDFVRYIIQEEYKKVPTASSGKYIFTGEKNSYEFYRDISTTSAVEHLLKTRGRTQNNLFESKLAPLEVVDIGTAQGKVLDHLKLTYGDRVNLTGISATDYYHNKSKPTNFTYIVGDVHNYFDIPNKYDLIFSQHTMYHLPDPGKVLVDAYCALKPNGLLIFDCVPMWHVSLEGTFALINYLRDQGYRLAAYAQEATACTILSSPPYGINMPGQLMVVVIEKTKTKPKLDLPLEYLGAGNDMYGSRVLYKLSLPNEYRFSSVNSTVQYHSANPIKNRSTLVSTVMGNIGMFKVPKKRLGTEPFHFDEDLREIFDQPKLFLEKEVIWKQLAPAATHYGFFTFHELVRLRCVNKSTNESVSQQVDKINAEHRKRVTRR